MLDFTLRTVLLGAALLGATAGALGALAVLRRQSLLGDAISHAALPGVALAFLVTGSKAPLVLALGAGLTGWLATVTVARVARHPLVRYDSALATSLAVFFGAGLMLLTFLRKRPDAQQAGLDRFLFGQAAALVPSDVWTMAVLAAFVLAALALFWKELKLLVFDPAFAAAVGLPVRRMDLLFSTLLVVAVVLGLQTVGVVLMSALVVAPGVASRQWSNRLGVVVGLAAAFGAAAGVSGAWLSATAEHLPTGPTIVLCAAALVAVSILFAPARGLLWRRSGRRR